MPESSIRNFSIASPVMGQVVVQPVTLEPVELESAALLVYPQRIAKEIVDVGVEWAASTQTPIFCMGGDIERFEREGFGAYRFHRLDGYKEVDFQGGSIEFFPAKQKRAKGIRGLGTNIIKLLGRKNMEAFHFILRPKGEAPVLYLASSQLDAHEWDLLMKANPSHIIGAPSVTKLEWHAFSTKVKRRIYTTQELGSLKTVARAAGQAEELRRENPMWAAKSGSL